MKTLEADAQCGTRIQQLREKAKARARFTSVHLLLLAFVVVMTFGAVMKLSTDEHYFIKQFVNSKSSL